MDSFPFLTLLVPEQHSEGKPTTVLMRASSNNTHSERERTRDRKRQRKRGGETAKERKKERERKTIDERKQTRQNREKRGNVLQVCLYPAVDTRCC